MRNYREYYTLQFVCAIAAIILTGCSTYAVDRYSISPDNVVVWKRYGEKINVGEFTATKPGISQINCRGVGPIIKTPDGNPFEVFIREAFIDELQIAELYSPSALISLTGNLNEIDFSSDTGFWRISLTVHSSNGKSFSIIEEYNYTTSFYGESACSQTAQALMPAVQNTISKVINHQSFPALLGR